MTASRDRQEDIRVLDFIAACEMGRLPDVHRLAGLIGNVDAPNTSGKTGLMASAARNRLEVMVFLLMQGADPNKTNANGTTPLMFAKTAAFTYGDCEGMRILLEAGADKNARDKSGLTALEYTVRNARMVREFLEKY